MDFLKHKKLNSILKEIVSRSILEHIDESDFGLVTINQVNISTDLSYLDVYVSSLKNSDTLCKTLAKSAYLVKRDISREISLRKMPIVRFRYDDQMRQTTKILDTIKDLK